MRRGVRHLLALASVGVLALTLAGTAGAARYLVVFKNGHSHAGAAAVKKAGGRIIATNKIGVATALATRRSFAPALRASGAVAGVARDATFRGSRRTRTPFRVNVNTASAEAITCAALYGGAAPVGPDPLAPCQWDMRAISANPGSYSVNTGQGARIGDIDTGIDLTHPEFAGNLDVAASCSFIYATTPTSNPAEQVTPGDCSNKAAVQDLNGHGTHTAGIIAAEIDGHGTSGVAPDATVVALKAGTEQGFFFTDSVVNALVYAGDRHLDAVNMSFFADPWLFNCRKDTEQKAIVQAIGRAARYAQQRGVVLVAAAGNEGINLNHPTVDEISPDYPDGAAVTRQVNNNCVVLPTELPGVVVVTATGAQNLLAWYSSYGNLTDVTAPGGSRFQTPTFDSARGRVLAPYSSTAGDLALEDALGRLVQDPSTGAYYAWLNGTSMAAPHAAGVVALIRARHPRMPVGSVIATLRGTATALACPSALDPGVAFFEAPVQVCSGGPGSNNFYGKGLVNALAAATR
jgi:lantibiotic leader peptide-processing serine protease